VTLEKRGIHTVTIVWESFEKAARMAARVQGVPNIQLAVIPNRKGTDTEDDQRGKADAAIPNIVKLLLTS
jgi:hypothetical protein